MNIFKFKLNSKIDEFSKSLAGDFINVYTLETAGASKKNDKKLAKAKNTLFIKIESFKKENKLGVYRKARIGNKFMWTLREYGFEKEFTEGITKELLYKLNE